MSTPRVEPLHFAPSASRSALSSYDLGGFWDEVFAASGAPRPHYDALSRRLAMPAICKAAFSCSPLCGAPMARCTRWRRGR